MLFRPMRTAPLSETIIVITNDGAHRANYDADPRFKNYWSDTAGRALTPAESIGWLRPKEWREFVRSWRNSAVER